MKRAPVVKRSAAARAKDRTAPRADVPGRRRKVVVGRASGRVTTKHGSPAPPKTSKRAATVAVAPMQDSPRAETSERRASSSTSPILGVPGAQVSGGGATASEAPNERMPRPRRLRRGQDRDVTHVRTAAAPFSGEAGAIHVASSGQVVPPPARRSRVCRGQSRIEIHSAHAAAGEGAMPSPAPIWTAPLADVVASLRELHRERQDYHSAEKRMTLQVKSIQRRTHALTCPNPIKGKSNARKRCGCEDVYGALTPAALVLMEQQAALKAHRLRPEKAMQKLVEQLPVWPWWESVRGVGALGLAQIVAEAGDLAQYANPAKLWKRMGLGMYQRTDGQWERQRKAEGDNGVLAGYSPTRRSIVFVIGESIIKAGGPYRELYDTRKVDEQAKPACGRAKCTGEHCTPGHIHNRSKRWMEKRLLRDLWRRWRADVVVAPNEHAPDAAAEAEPDAVPA